MLAILLRMSEKSVHKKKKKRIGRHLSIIFQVESHISPDIVTHTYLIKISSYLLLLVFTSLKVAEIDTIQLSSMLIHSFIKEESHLAPKHCHLKEGRKKNSRMIIKYDHK